MYADKRWIVVSHHGTNLARLAVSEHVTTGQVVITYYPVEPIVPPPAGFVENHDSLAKAEAHLAEVFPISKGYKLRMVVGQV